MDSEVDKRMSSYQETENDFLQFAQDLMDNTSNQTVNNRYSSCPGLRCLFALTSFLEEATASEHAIISSELQSQPLSSITNKPITKDRNTLDALNASQNPNTEQEWDGVYLTHNYTNALKAQKNKGLDVGSRLSTTMKRVKTKIMRVSHHAVNSNQNVERVKHNSNQNAERVKHNSAGDYGHIGALVLASTNSFSKLSDQQRAVHSVDDLLDTDEPLSQGDFENLVDFDDKCQSLPDILYTESFRRSYDEAMASPHVSPTSKRHRNRLAILELPSASLDQIEYDEELARGEQTYLNNLREKAVSKQFAKKMKQWHEQAEAKFGVYVAGKGKTRAFRLKGRKKKPSMHRQRSRSHDRLLAMSFDYTNIIWSHQRSASQELPCSTDNEFMDNHTPQSVGHMQKTGETNSLQNVSDPTPMAMHVDTNISQSSASKTSSSTSPDSGTESCHDCIDEIEDKIDTIQSIDQQTPQNEPGKTSVVNSSSCPLERGRRVSPSRAKKVISRHSDGSISVMDASFDELAIGESAKFSNRHSDLSEEGIFSTSPTRYPVRRLSLDMPSKSSPPLTFDWKCDSLPKDTSPYTSEETLAGIAEDLKRVRESKVRAQAESEHSDNSENSRSNSPKLEMNRKPSIISVCVDSGLIMEESEDEMVEYDSFMQLSPKQTNPTNSSGHINNIDTKMDSSNTPPLDPGSLSNPFDLGKPFEQYNESNSEQLVFPNCSSTNAESSILRTISTGTKMPRQQRLDVETLQSGEFQPNSLETSPVVENPLSTEQSGAPDETSPVVESPLSTEQSGAPDETSPVVESPLSTEQSGAPDEIPVITTANHQNKLIDKHTPKTDSSSRNRTIPIVSASTRSIHDLVNKFTSTDSHSSNSSPGFTAPLVYTNKSKQQIRYLLETGTVERRRTMFMDSRGRSHINSETEGTPRQGAHKPSHQRVKSNI